MFTTYPDVYPNPPVSVEQLRANAQQLREADEAARKAEAVAVAAEEKLEESKRAYAAAINEFMDPPKKPVLPN